MKFKILALGLVIFFAHELAAIASTVATETKSATELVVNVTLNLDPQEALFEDSLTISVDNPHLTLTWQTNNPLVDVFDPSIQLARKAYSGSVTITSTLQKNADEAINNAHLHMYYLTNRTSQPGHLAVPITFENPTTAVNPEVVPQAEPTQKHNRYVPSQQAEIMYNFEHPSTYSRELSIKPMAILLVIVIIGWIFYVLGRKYQIVSTNKALIAALFLSAALVSYGLLYLVRFFIF